MQRTARSLLLLLALPARGSAQLNTVPFDIRVPRPPLAVHADGAMHLSYELHVTNIGTKERAISRLEVFGASGGSPLIAWDSSAVRGASRVFGAPPTANGTILPAGRQSVIYLWIDIADAQKVPSQLQHRIIVSPPDSATSARRDTLDGYLVPVQERPPRVLAPPFSGGPWIAVNGPSNTSGHRRTFIPIAGEARIAQRFATDWVKLGADGLLFHGDSTKNANWYGYGTPILAVADGIVTEVKDGIIENVPNSPTMAVPITLETVGGNHVILDIGGGLFAFYAHLQPGSLRVSLGQRVKKGQVVGLLGNSGNSTAPHLHFHVGDTSSPLGTEGQPFVFDLYDRLDRLTGDVESMTGAWKQPATGARRVTKELPLENTVVRFP